MTRAKRGLKCMGSDGGRGNRRDASRSGRADLADQRIAILIGHRDIGKQDVHLRLLENLQGLACVSSEADARAAILQRVSHHFPAVVLVVDNEHANAIETNATRRLRFRDGTSGGVFGLPHAGPSAHSAPVHSRLIGVFA